MAHPKKKAASLVCSASGNVYTDVSYSDLFNGDFACGDCGLRLKLPTETTHKNRVAVVARHSVPASVAEYRETLHTK